MRLVAVTVRRACRTVTLTPRYLLLNKTHRTLLVRQVPLPHACPPLTCPDRHGPWRRDWHGPLRRDWHGPLRRDWLVSAGRHRRDLSSAPCAICGLKCSDRQAAAPTRRVIALRPPLPRNTRPHCPPRVPGPRSRSATLRPRRPRNREAVLCSRCRAGVVAVLAAATGWPGGPHTAMPSPSRCAPGYLASQPRLGPAEAGQRGCTARGVSRSREIPADRHE